MTLNEVLLFGIALNVTAGLGAFGFAFLDDRIGSKPTILIAICGLFVAGTVALLAEEKSTFWAVALVIGIFVGPAQSASRTLMARLAPAEQRTEMFGIYALTGKVTAFIGPFLFGTATAWFQTPAGRDGDDPGDVRGRRAAAAAGARAGAALGGCGAGRDSPQNLTSGRGATRISDCRGSSSHILALRRFFLNAKPMP